ncbi:MAG: hypothetical protein KJS83_12500, partial [Xanthomonadaceae bacterium]|nr:hypothetical protein [Xanthomonadaceae bacterium]
MDFSLADIRQLLELRDQVAARDEARLLTRSKPDAVTRCLRTLHHLSDELQSLLNRCASAECCPILELKEVGAAALSPACRRPQKRSGVSPGGLASRSHVADRAYAAMVLWCRWSAVSRRGPNTGLLESDRRQAVFARYSGDSVGRHSCSHRRTSGLPCLLHHRADVRGIAGIGEDDALDFVRRQPCAHGHGEQVDLFLGAGADQ